MQLEVTATPDMLGERAAALAGAQIRSAIAARGQANVIVATGASQFATLAALIRQPDIAWQKVVFFHLDEYVGMADTHPASFRRYLRERLVDHLPQPPKAFHFIDGEGDCQAECQRLGELIAQHPIDVALIGIGENGHLAFNDPPADFATEQPYIVVKLDDACRRQQLGEGWFPSLDDVPTTAISMSIRQIMKSHTIVCSVPDQRKAAAVGQTFIGPVTPDLPASILQRHARTVLFLDEAAASGLSGR